MTISQFNALVAVARYGSVKAAARDLRVSPAAVSQAVASLRKEFDDDLYVREGSGVSLTALGRELVGLAGEILGLMGQARRLGGDAEERRAPLRVAATGTFAEYYAAPLMEAFARRHPDLEVQVEIWRGGRFREALLLRRVDLTIGPDAILDRGVETAPFLRYEMIAVSGARRSPGTGPDPDPTSGHPWLLGPYDTDPTSEVGRVLAATRATSTGARIFPSHAAATAAVAAGHGVTMAIAQAVDEELAQGIMSRFQVTGTPVGGVWHVSTLSGNMAPISAQALRRFLATPEAARATLSGRGGVPPRRSQPPIHITLWSGVAARQPTG